MGTAPSKQQSKQDGRYASVLHSVSLPSGRSRLEAVEDGRKFSWKSRLSSLPKLVGRESSRGSMFRLSSNLGYVPEEDLGALAEELSELKEAQTMSVGVSRTKSLQRSLSFQPSWESSPESNSSVSQKSLRKEAKGGENSATKNLSLKLDSVFDSLPRKDAVMERSAGLRSLLSPVLIPSHGFASPTRVASNPSKTLASRMTFNSRINDSSPGKSSLNVRSCSSPGKGTLYSRSSSFRDLPADNGWKTKLDASPNKSNFSVRSRSFCDLPVVNSPETKLDSLCNAELVAEPAGSPLFDPILLATFEKALECLSDDGDQSLKALECLSDDSHQSSDSNTNDNSSSTSESDSSSDMESLHLPQSGTDCFEDFNSVTCREGRILNSPPMLRANAFLIRKVSFSRVFSLKNDENWTGKDYLHRFETRCPPGGENKVILYFTSLRAVRKTYEDCCMIRLILKGLRIHVDERDVWMHSKFRKELTEIMGATLPVPRLFIVGRHIGGAEEVEQLHEEGILGKMLEGLATDSREECQVCRDVRFIPCITCSGSCKFVSEEDVIERCPDCNENGLIMCPYCDW